MAIRQQDQGGFRTYATQPSDGGDSSSVIDQYSNFDGTYHSTRDLRIEGNVKGSIECRGTLHIAQGASVNAKVEAENISIAGELDGEITCRGRLQLLPSGRVKGVIRTQTLVIHEGAFYEGELEMGGQDGRANRAARRSRQIEVATPDTDAPGASVGTVETPSRSETAQDVPAATPPSTFIRRFGGQEQQFHTARQSPPESNSAPAAEE